MAIPACNKTGKYSSLYVVGIDQCRKELNFEYNGSGNRVSTIAQNSAAATGEPLNITVNGEARAVPATLTLLELIHQLELDPQRVAVELNRRIVKRENWAAAVLNEGAALEIVQFVGGG
jgi:sulfur carrier protein